MDQIAQWRPVEAAGPEAQPAVKAVAAAEQGRRSAALVGGVAALVLAAAGVVLWATTPQPEVVLQPVGQAGGALGTDAGAGFNGAPPSAPADVVVDVQGAVTRPGLHRLPAGSRVGDAVAAAGGYDVDVDIAAAAQRLNLAQRLADGDKIHVPVRGEEAAHPAAAAQPTLGAAGGGDAGGLIDVNTASEAQLDTLPGIGPVTAAKIIAAREEAAFATVDELLGRKVVGAATFEKIRELITVGP